MKHTPLERTPRADPPEPAPASTIVGIGASAGGLEALEQFFQAAATLPGCAFVVVQHLSASQPSLLPQLLRRITDLTVVDVANGVHAQAGFVYVAPPGFDVGMREGHFVLAAQRESTVPRLPIDSFFRSLSEDQHANAVGVILSGMGSDGTLGLRAMKERAGTTFVQLPETAQFDSMPRSAIQAGVADVVASPEELPARIGEFIANLRQPSAHDDASVPDAVAVDSIIVLLREVVGHDFAHYKRSTVQRRIERRMALHHRRSFADYERFLRENRGEIQFLFRELLIGVTSFFRDPTAWEQLRAEVIPQLLETLADGATVRVWVAGCSTGEEVYSLAIIFAEAISELRPAGRLSLKIFATDIDSDAIDRARIGRYPLNIAADVSPTRLAEFFVQDEFGFQIRKDLRESVIFAIQNVTMDPPFTKLDMLLCRNLLIYFEPTLQRKLLPLFHYSLQPNGLLMLGNAETIGTATEYFVPVPGKARLFRRLESFRRSGFVALPSTFGRHSRAAPPGADLVVDDGERTPNLQVLADHLLLQRYSPAAVLVTKQGDVLYVSGKTGKYLEPAAGKANWNVFAMARIGLSQALGTAFREAVRDSRSVTSRGVISDSDVGTLQVRLTVDPISSPKALIGMVMIVFLDEEVSPVVEMPDAVENGAHPLELDLSRLRAALQVARDDAQSLEEQYRAANEELQSTNEELQSTNEELTTSKEEMQSMNEELQTVNQELQAKVDELSQSSDDMRNLLNSTDIATIFLDESLRIRRFTLQSLKLFKLIQTDIGRPITDITNELTDWKVADDAREVLNSLVFREREVSASSGRWFKVRTMPYRTSQNKIDGVVITFSDISGAKALELELLARQTELEQLLGRPKPATSRGTQKGKSGARGTVTTSRKRRA